MNIRILPESYAGQPANFKLGITNLVFHLELIQEGTLQVRVRSSQFKVGPRSVL